MNLASAQEKEFLKDERGNVLDVVKVTANYPCCGSGREPISLISMIS